MPEIDDKPSILKGMEVLFVDNVKWSYQYLNTCNYIKLAIFICVILEAELSCQVLTVKGDSMQAEAAAAAAAA